MHCRILTIISVSLFLFAFNTEAQQTIEPLPSLNPSDVHIIEGASFCSAGLSTQTLLFNIEENLVFSDDITSPYLPSFDFYNSPALNLGCNFSDIVFDFSYYENSIKFNKLITYKDTDYNLLEFKLNQISVGYSFSLIPHLLYLDLGLGYSQIQFTLDFVSEGSVRNDAIHIDDSGSYYQVNFNLFLSAHIFVNWLNQQSFDSSGTVFYSNQLGLNFLVKL